MDEYTVQDAARLLHVSEKTIYRWIETGKLKARKYGIQHFILKSNVEKLVTSRPIQPSVDETGLEVLQQRLDLIEQRLSNLEEKLQRLEHAREPPQPRVHSQVQDEQAQPAHSTRAPSHAFKSAIPDGYVLLRHFNEIHGMKDTTVARRIDQGILSVTRGEWQHGRQVVRQLLSPEQQRKYYQALHTSPGFTRCKACPHDQE